MKNYLGALLYLGLLACALVYIRDSFIEYLSGKTYYTVSQEPITMHDVPTVTLCSDQFREMPLEGEYGKTFRIQLLYIPDPDCVACDDVYGLNVSKISIGISANKGEYTCEKLQNIPQVKRQFLSVMIWDWVSVSLESDNCCL